MNAHKMMQAIAQTLNQNESITINVTYARGRTLVESYNVGRCGIQYIGHKWGGRGNVRREYAKRVLAQG